MQFLSLFIRKKKEKKTDFQVNLDAITLEDIKSLEYEIFKEEEKYASLPRTIYEKLTHILGKIVPIDPDKKTAEELEDAMSFAHLNINPKGYLSLVILSTLFITSTMFILWIFGFIGNILLVFGLLFSVVVAYYLYTYPSRLKKIFELKAGSEIVMLILHIVIYMRNFPNLESAVKFASSKLTGPLALDMKKLIWDVYMDMYSSMEEALLSYSLKWKKNFKAFSDSINAIVYSLYTSGKRKLELLDESIEIILQSLSERSDSYVSKLKTPVTMVNAMGILLPTLVLTMLPILTVFLGGEIPPSIVFGFYDLLLPMALIFIIKNILDQRVITLPEPDISLHPDLPPNNMFRIGNYYISCFLPAILVFIPFAYYSYLIYLEMNTSQPYIIFLKSYIFTLGIFISLAIFFFLNSFQKIKLRREIAGMEDEFRQILFGLGQELDRGVPIEVGLEKIVPTLRGHYAINLIQSILSNIRYQSLTFKEAIFHKEKGAILKFPSKLIYSILQAVVEASRKGVKIVSEILLYTSRYLNDLHKTQQQIQDKFSEVLSSMHMQAKILLPLITGIMNTLTYTIIEMLNFMQNILGSINLEGGAAQYASILKMWSGVHIHPATFQIAIGIYTIETIIILSWFISGISVGADKVSMYDIIYKNLIIGCILYILVSLISLMVFTPFLGMVKVGVTSPT